MNSRTVRISISKAFASYRGAKSALDRAIPQLKKITQQTRFNRIARDTLQEIAQHVQQSAHTSISRIVSECLTASFPDPYTFKLEFVKKRGKTEAHLDFWKRGEKFKPTEESGGGVLDVAAFGLRLACVMLREDVQKVLILDEPFKMVGKEDTERVKNMLWNVSNELGVQIVMITHNPDLVVGKEIKLSRR